MTPSPEPPATAPPWTAWQRLCFRYLACHCLLFALPAPVSWLLSTLVVGLRYLARTCDLAWLQEEPFSWPAMAQAHLGAIDDGWRQLTTWLAAHSLLPFDVIHQDTASGDTGYAFARLACIVLASLGLAGLWSLVGNRRGYPRLGRWLHLFARWHLGLFLVVAGLEQVLASRFAAPGLDVLTQQVGDKSPTGLAWLFFGVAPACQQLVGGVAVLAGALLLWHRTAAFGACVAAVGMANVVGIAWAFDAPVKIVGAHWLLYAVALLAPWRGRLWALFVTNRSSEPVAMAVVRSGWLRCLLVGFGSAAAVAFAVERSVGLGHDLAQQEARRGAQPALYGVWDVASMRLDGAEVAAGDPTRWRFVALDHGPKAWLERASGKRDDFALSEDVAGGKLQWRSPASGEAVTWAFELGQRLTKAENPEPQRLAEVAAQVDVPQRTLTLRGTWQGRACEVLLVERGFRLGRRLHLRQELPYLR